MRDVECLGPIKPMTIASTLDPSGKQYIHVLLSGQLGNCLRNIASMKIIADHIEASWDIDFSQSETTTDVNRIIAQLFPDRSAKHPRGSYLVSREQEVFRFIDIYGTNSHPLVEALFDSPPAPAFGVRHIYAVRPVLMSDAEYVQRKLSFYSTILWPDYIVEMVESFERDNGPLSRFVGCHIRYTDNLYDPVKHKLKLNTPLFAFIERLVAVQQPVLLCTDNQLVRDLIRQAFASASILFPDTCRLAGWQAVYEMQLLARTRYLIGSFSSTFSYEACFIEGTDLQLFRNGGWIEYAIREHPSGSNATPAMVDVERKRS